MTFSQITTENYVISGTPCALYDRLFESPDLAVRHNEFEMSARDCHKSISSSKLTFLSFLLIHVVVEGEAGEALQRIAQGDTSKRCNPHPLNAFQQDIHEKEEADVIHVRPVARQ